MKNSYPFNALAMIPDGHYELTSGEFLELTREDKGSIRVDFEFCAGEGEDPFTHRETIRFSPGGGVEVVEVSEEIEGASFMSRGSDHAIFVPQCSRFEHLLGEWVEMNLGGSMIQE